MQRPIITDYTDFIQFIGDMLSFLKQHDANFSVLKASKSLRKVSPALVSLILKRKRRLTFDRVDEISKLLNLTPHEKQFLKDHVAKDEGVIPASTPLDLASRDIPRRKVTSVHLLADWVNVFVKDAFQLTAVRQNPSEIYSILGGIASKNRIDQSIRFLLAHGYLRKTIEGHLVPEVPVHSIDPQVPSLQIRKFHKAALSNAREAIDQHGPEKRYANAMVLTLNEENYKKITELIAEQADQLQKFAENLENGNQLYQLVINLSPTGGRRGTDND